MALLDMQKSWVGVQRRADANVRQPGYWPRAYVRLDLEGSVTNIDPDDARQLAKALTGAANMIDPPKPRKAKA